MKKIKPLYIDKEKRLFGTKVDCSECSLVFDVCKKTGLPLEKCPHGEKHTFKVIAYEEGTGKRRTKALKTRDIKEALLQAARFQEEVKSANNTKEFQEPLTEKKQDSYTLIEAFAKHVAYLRGENVPEHKRKVRTEKHCKQTERTYLSFIKSIKKDYNVKELKADQVDQNMIGKFYASIMAHGYGARTYNMMMGSMKSFYNYLIREGQATVNPFSGIIRKPESHTISVLTKEEYCAILEAVQKPELGFRKVGRETKSMYRPWVKDAIQTGLMTGRRSEEIIKMKWKDIVENSTGDDIHSISIIDYKVSRQQNRLHDNPKRISVPITGEFKKLLLSLGYDTHKGTDKYIIANDETMSRDSMRKFMSHSFSHYWKKLGFQKKASYKTLRKTYLSSLSASIGISNAQIISQHSDTKVLSDHYVSSEIIGRTVKNFSVFPEQNESRQNELNELRKSNKNISLER